MDSNDPENSVQISVDEAAIKDSPHPGDCMVPDVLEIGQLATTWSSGDDEFVTNDEHAPCAGQRVVYTASTDGDRVDFDTVDGQQLMDITGEPNDAE